MQITTTTTLHFVRRFLRRNISSGLWIIKKRISGIIIFAKLETVRNPIKINDEFIIFCHLFMGTRRSLYKILILCIFVGDVASSQNIYFSTLKSFFYLTSLTFFLLCELLCKEFLCFYVFSDLSSPFVVQLNLRQIRLWNWSHVMNFSFSPFLGGSERIPNTKKRQRKMLKCNYVSIISSVYETRRKRLAMMQRINKS